VSAGDAILLRVEAGEIKVRIVADSSGATAAE
jgi:hypothetical protein